MDLAPLIFKVSIRQKSHPVRHLKSPVKSRISEDQKITKKNKNRTSMDGVGISVWGNEKGEVTTCRKSPVEKYSANTPAECLSTGAGREKDYKFRVNHLQEKRRIRE